MWRLFILLFLLAQPLRAQDVDIELVLAVDTSRSMDVEELELQREGYAAAFEHPAFLAALTTTRIAVTYFDWGGSDRHDVILPWRILRNAEDARHAASVLRASPVKNLSGTGISGAILKGIELIEENEISSERRVIDISGDGPNNEGPPVELARDLAMEAGIEVNGLPIMLKKPYGPYNVRDLDIYYADCVITGPLAFVLPVFEADRLIGSILQKIVLEIAGLRPQGHPKLQNASTTDCMIGEKLREERMRQMEYE